MTPSSAGARLGKVHFARSVALVVPVAPHAAAVFNQVVRKDGKLDRMRFR